MQEGAVHVKSGPRLLVLTDVGEERRLGAAHGGLVMGKQIDGNPENHAWTRFLQGNGS